MLPWGIATSLVPMANTNKGTDFAPLGAEGSLTPVRAQSSSTRKILLVPQLL